MEAATRIMHFAQQPFAGLGRDAPEQGVAGGQRGFRVTRQQRAVVVQHLFEVRDHPVLID